MFAPITGTEYLNVHFPLKGIAESIGYSFPEWIQVSSTGALLSKLLTSLFDHTEAAAHRLNSLKRSVNVGNGDLFEPRLIFITQTPPKLINEVTDSYSQDLRLYFNTSTTGTWTSLYVCKDLVELYSSIGPCIYIDNQLSVLRNIEKSIMYVTGTPAGTLFSYNISDVLEDTALLYTEDINTPSDRWFKFTSEDYSAAELQTTASGMYVYKTAINYPTNFYVKWLASSTSGVTPAYPSDLRNDWDEQALKAGLTRKYLETNVSLRDRLKASLFLAKNQAPVTLAINIARELGAINYFVWDGNSALDTGSEDHVFLPEVEKITWKMDVIKKYNQGNNEYFTSSIRTPIYDMSFVNGEEIRPTSAVSGLLEYNTNLSLYEDTHMIYRQVIYQNWSLSGSYILPTENLPRKDYIVLSTPGIKVTSLTDKSIESRIRDSYILTNFTRSILLEHKNKIPIYYSNGKWGRTRFFSREETKPSSTIVPTTFED